MKKKDIGRYEKKALKVRKRIMGMVSATKSPHIGPSFSCVEILVALYFKVMRISAGTLRSPDRDRFIMSKGHACPALYAVLAEKGFMTERAIAGFAVNGGELQQHPDRDLGHGIEVSTGSLGQGLSIAAGMALDAKARGRKCRVFTLLGDGEMNEGSVWEAVIFAGHNRLNGLVAIVDHNKMQALGHSRDIADLEPLKEKFETFGWHARDVDGHDLNDIFRAFGSLSAAKPNALIMHTVKGKGVSFMENELLWHYRYPREDEYALAMKELSE
jgi:transketolase